MLSPARAVPRADPVMTPTLARAANPHGCASSGFGHGNSASAYLRDLQAVHSAGSAVDAAGSSRRDDAVMPRGGEAAE